MKISLNWLNEYLSKKVTAEEAASILTNVGLEVEDIEVFESIKGGLQGVVIGAVKEKEKHPDADRLSVTKVDIGLENFLQIVCGAPNVEVGQKVVVATVGATLYPNGEKLEIKKSKIRGVESQGMICAEDELGLGKSHDGIMILPNDTFIGIKAATFFKLENDYTLELNITPNRSDATSHIGVARDIVAFQRLTDENATLIIPKLNTFLKEGNKDIQVEIENTIDCPRYSGIVLTDIKIAPSPQWLQNKLLAIGLKPINNVVDITNFVLYEFGHPLHAFDYDLIDGKKIIVKNVPNQTAFISLDGVERKLKEEDLMICSATKPLCIAGVYGGLASGVSVNTKTVFIESAYFNPVSIRKTAKNHALHTDASFRFERGTNPNITITAAQRAAQLMIEICNGKIASEVLDIYANKIENKTVLITYSKIRTVLGIDIPKEKIKNILIALDIEITNETIDSLHLTIPAYKVDVTRDVDVIEEIIRIYGLNEIEINTHIKAVFSGKENKNNATYKHKIAAQLIANGFFEILTNSLLNSKYQEKLEGEIKPEVVSILNPISSELNILRNEFIFSGLEVVAHNLNHKALSIKIFEFGKTYKYSTVNTTEYREHYTEQMVLGIWFCGNKNKESWHQKEQPVDFYDAKGVVETMLTMLKIPTQASEKITNVFLKKGFSITGLKNNKNPIAVFGEVSSSVLKIMDIKQPVYYAQLNWDLIEQQISTNYETFAELPKYPSVRRDLALVLDKKVAYKDLKETLFKIEKQLLQEVNIFDVYEGKGIPEEKKSYALSFIFRNKNRTLIDTEIDNCMQKLMDELKKEFNAEIRS